MIWHMFSNNLPLAQKNAYSMHDGIARTWSLSNNILHKPHLGKVFIKFFNIISEGFQGLKPAAGPPGWQLLQLSPGHLVLALMHLQGPSPLPRSGGHLLLTELMTKLQKFNLPSSQLKC